jgi:hypothetical protein
LAINPFEIGGRANRGKKRASRIAVRHITKGGQWLFRGRENNALIKKQQRIVRAGEESVVVIEQPTVTQVIGDPIGIVIGHLDGRAKATPWRHFSVPQFMIHSLQISVSRFAFALL